MTAKVPNPEHRSSHTIKVCFKCGKPILNKNDQITRPSNKQHGDKINPKKHYHKFCWGSTFT